VQGEVQKEREGRANQGEGKLVRRAMEEKLLSWRWSWR
jgi:hypothetical protein